MQSFFFAGVVHPERGGLNFPAVYAGGTDGSGGRPSQVDFTVSCGLVNGVVNVPVSETRDFAHMIARLTVQREVDRFGFLFAVGYEVEIHTVVSASAPHGSQTIGALVDHLATDADRQRRGDLLQRMPWQTDMGTAGIVLGAALGNPRRAARDTELRAFFAYRTAESIRQWFVEAEGQKDRNRSWDQLHAALGTTAEQLKVALFERTAVAVRHGEILEGTPEDAKAQIAAAFDLVERFMAYLTKKYPGASPSTRTPWTLP